MLVMTAKVDKKKIAMILAAAIVLVAGILLLAGGGDSQSTAAPTVSGNDARVAFLKSFGWDVATSPKESSQVKIPSEPSEAGKDRRQEEKGTTEDEMVGWHH